MGIPSTHRILHSFLFVDDHIIFAQDEDDTSNVVINRGILQTWP